MVEHITHWLETRAGLPGPGRGTSRRVAGGPRWRTVFGPALTATFLIQLITGLLLMSSYSPSTSQAWGSVWYIQNQMVLGWLIRGLHHFGSSAMVVLLALFVLQEVLTRAYRAPRELSWWLGLVLVILVLGLALTGYLLPWDQKGYWATKVATNIMGSTPVVGPYLLTVVIGGSEYGNLTLTRLYSVHVGLLPWLIMTVLVLRLWLHHRLRDALPADDPGAETARPGQMFRNLTAIAVVLMVLFGVVLWNGGANLEAPADPSVSDYPARPEWYFLSLFQMLNHFESPYEVIGTHLLPGVLFGFLFVLPFLDRVLPRKLVFGTTLAVLAMVFIGAGVLMTEAILADRSNVSFQLARREADAQRERSLQLVSAEGVPPDGAVYVLRRDPWTHGRVVLEQRCLSCHHDGGRGQVTRQVIAVSAEDLSNPDVVVKEIEGLPEPAARALAAKLPEFVPEGPARLEDEPSQVLAGFRLLGTNAQGDPMQVIVSPDGRHVKSEVMSRQTAADLAGFGSREWVRGLLEDPSSPRYFGTTPQLEGMRTWKAGTKLTPEQLDQVADFVAELSDVADGEDFFGWYERRYVGDLEDHPGHDLFVKDCGKCHFVGMPDYSFTEGGFMEAPNLFAYGSAAWIRRMILKPAAEDLYGYLPDEDRMPAFDGRLSENDLTTLVRYLRNDYIPPLTTAPATAGEALRTVAPPTTPAREPEGVGG